MSDQQNERAARDGRPQNTANGDDRAHMHEDVVSAFDELGYLAPFAAVARALGLEPAALYALYPSREALGEVWLASKVPDCDKNSRLHNAFCNFVFEVFRALESHRDFSRTWIAAMTAAAPLHLANLQDFHAQATTYFTSWLDANADDICLPGNVSAWDVEQELSDAFSAMALALIVAWEADRSVCASATRGQVESAGYVLDALLVCREDLGQSSLLVHLHALVDPLRTQWLKPLLDILLKPERVARLSNTAGLVELVRSLTIPPTP